MKANEYIKKYGVDRAKKLLSITSKMNMSGLVFASLEGGDNLNFEVDELKSLIESHDLVESFGGLEHAKRFLAENIPCTDSESLNNAIADVESCQ